MKSKLNDISDKITKLEYKLENLSSDLKNILEKENSILNELTDLNYVTEKSNKNLEKQFKKH